MRPPLRLEDFLPALFAARLFAVPFAADDLRPALRWLFDELLRELDDLPREELPLDFRAPLLLFAALLRAVLRCALDALLLRALLPDLLLLPLDFLLLAFLLLAFRGGTLSPSRRASESPMAIACFGFVTFLLLLPMRSLPSFISCSSSCTFSCVFRPYFLPPEDWLDVDFVFVAIDVLPSLSGKPRRMMRLREKMPEADNLYPLQQPVCR